MKYRPTLAKLNATAFCLLIQNAAAISVQVAYKVVCGGCGWSLKCDARKDEQHTVISYLSTHEEYTTRMEQTPSDQLANDVCALQCVPSRSPELL